MLDEIISKFTRMAPYKYIGESLPCNLCESNKREIIGRRDRYGNKLTTSLCMNCGLVFTDPMPTEEEIDRYYARFYRKHYHNAFRQDAELHAAITRKVRRNGATVLWTYAPGFAGTDGGDPERKSKLIGMQVECLPRGVASCQLSDVRKHPVTSALTASPGCAFPLAPAFNVNDDEAEILAWNEICAGLADREFPECRSVYSLLAPDRELLLGLYRYAGVHISCDTFDKVGAS